jgi:aminopeptidase N
VAGEVTNAQARAIGGGFWQHGQDELLRPYADSYVDAVPQLWERLTPVLAASLTTRLFPSTLVDQEVHTLTGRLLEQHDLPAGARRIVSEQHDDLRRALHAQQSASD